MKKYKLLTRDEAPEIMIHESVKEDFKKSIGWDDGRKMSKLWRVDIF